MSVESFDSQDIAAETQRELDDNPQDLFTFPEANEATNAEVLADHKMLMNTFNINSDFFRGEHLEAVKNVFQNICGGKNFDQIEMNDIYKLTHAEKSQLAREIASLRKYREFFLPKSNIKFSDLRKHLEKKDSSMTVESLNKAMNVNWDAKKRNDVFEDLRNMIVDKAVNEYWKMRKESDEIPPMQDICLLAAGNLSPTTGIGGKKNIGREFFAYNLENSTQSINSLEFGPYDSPAEIGISAYGYDNGGGGRLTISLGDGGSNMVWNYTKSGLNMDDSNSLPDGITWENGVLTISKKQYENTPIKIEIESINNDEIMFNLQCKNASITTGGTAEIIRTPSVMEEFKPGIYKLTEREKQNFLRGVDAILRQARKTKKTNIPVVFEVGIDSKKFDNKKAFEGKDVEMLNDLKNKYSSNSDLVKKIQQEYDEFSSKIDLSGKFTQDQIDVQTRLAKLRFLEAISVALTNATFRVQFASGKIDINSRLSIGTRKIEAKIESDDDLNYKPQKSK